MCSDRMTSRARALLASLVLFAAQIETDAGYDYYEDAYDDIETGACMAVRCADRCARWSRVALPPALNARPVDWFSGGGFSRRCPVAAQMEGGVAVVFRVQVPPRTVDPEPEVDPDPGKVAIERAH